MTARKYKQQLMAELDKLSKLTEEELDSTKITSTVYRQKSGTYFRCKSIHSLSTNTNHVHDGQYIDLIIWL